MNRSCDIRINKISIVSLTLWLYAIAAVVTDEGSMLMKLARVILIGVFAIYLLLKKEFRNNNYILCMGVFCLIAISSTNWAINKVHANAMGKTLSAQHQLIIQHNCYAHSRLMTSLNDKNVEQTYSYLYHTQTTFVL